MSDNVVRPDMLTFPKLIAFVALVVIVIVLMKLSGR